ncbi:polysaccharide deacetylase family protein [Aurantiacibacter aquimixticola]|nr:polysaccharide deacetylase family protein [Aurantiacibacter aquimixticola]
MQERRIALTFDDVPRGAGAFLPVKDRADMLRQGLRDAGVEQAAFFINPGKLAENPERAADIMAYMADGHVMANHTSTHPSLRDLTVPQFLAEIDAAEEWLVQLDNHRPWFRYPFLNEGGGDAAKRDGVRDGLAERGLRNGYVTVDASDWFYEANSLAAQRARYTIDMDALCDLFVESHVEAADFFDRLAIDAIGRSPAHVMLLHEADVTVMFLGDLVEALQADGWTIIPADEAYDDALGAFAATYDTPSAQGTLIEMVAWERGLPAPRWYPRNDIAVARAEYDRRVLGIEEGAAE